MFSTYTMYDCTNRFCSLVVSEDTLGLGVRDVLVAIGMRVSEGAGGTVTTGTCTSSQYIREEMTHTANTLAVFSYM